MTCAVTNAAIATGDCTNAQTTYAYNGRGDLTTITSDPNVTNYAWDARDRLTTATLPSGSASFVYDDLGHRVQQTANGVITNYQWDEASPYGDVIRESDATNTETASYVLGGPELLSQKRGSTTSYYLHDGQGSVRNLTNTSGVVTDTYVYDAYGNGQHTQGSTVNPYQYTGQQFDSATGLYDLRARYYSQSLAEFSSRDLAIPSVWRPNSFNRYIFALNTPINYSDPSGRDVFDLGRQLLSDITESVSGLIVRATETAYLKVFIGSGAIATLEALCEASGEPDCDIMSILLKFKDEGQQLAYEACNLANEVRDVVGDKPMFNVTIGVAKVVTDTGTQIYYFLNSSAPQIVRDALFNATGGGTIIQIAGEHAEVGALDWFGDQLTLMGISNSGGVCAACQGEFTAVPVPIFYLLNIAFRETINIFKVTTQVGVGAGKVDNRGPHERLGSRRSKQTGRFYGQLQDNCGPYKTSQHRTGCESHRNPSAGL